MSTIGTILHRTPIVGVDTPGTQVSKNVWNDTIVVASAAPNGAVVVRDSAQPDGWGFGDLGWLDVRTFGTVGAAAWQAAIDALPAIGGTVIGPDANYSMSAVLTVNKPCRLVFGRGTITFTMADPGTGVGAINITNNNVAIVGAGDATVFTQGNGAEIQTAFHVHANDRIAFRDFQFDWNDVNQTNVAGYFTGLRSSAGASHLTVNGCLFTRAGDRAIDFRGSSIMRITGNRFITTGLTVPSGGGGNAISVDVDGATRSTDLVVSDNYFESVGDTCIGIPCTRMATITGNVMRGAADVGVTPGTYEGGISLNGCSDVWCGGNTIRKMKEIGIIANDKNAGGVHYPVSRVSIVGNTLLQASGGQTIIQGSATANTSGNSRGLVVADNVIDMTNSTSGSPISFGGAYYRNIVITGNLLQVDTVTAGQIAILLSGTGLDVYTISGNTIANFARGIEIQSGVGANGTVSHNTVSGTGVTHVVNAQNATPPLILGNFGEGLSQNYVGIGLTAPTAPLYIYSGVLPQFVVDGPSEVRCNLKIAGVAKFFFNHDGTSGAVGSQSGNCNLYGGNIHVATLTAGGKMGVGTTEPVSRFEVSTAAATMKGLIVRGFAAQSANLQEWLDSGANELMVLDAAGRVGIGLATPNANALLDVSSTTKAFMPPRMTTTQRDAIPSPTAGMVVYNATTAKLNLYTTAWEAVTSV